MKLLTWNVQWFCGLDGTVSVERVVDAARSIVDFDFEAHDPEYALIQAEPAPPATRLHDAWPLLHGSASQAPTFRLHDRRYGPLPIACDFVFVSAGLAPHLRRIEVDAATRASDHQPVFVELG